ncbi:UDP-N-acetylglucosamine 2-epimerase [Nocardioides sp. BP30]|uniref:UDP-N-acetylglucosamine 2-epimerase n=1 Tax=Nocardioides sp. BP30 TaxID=3036374 RepID=UPI002468A15A|nr:UDP-N-acetylglucosamine 2-epimerase [Nocardioides sp. BP30]WGL51912.1 UDP-N-acetylglucosamine 2-epimerase [Nocardioides sp. BP30]
MPDRTVKRVTFLTGTRADYGKLKPIMLALEHSPLFEAQVFITGMHMHRQYGDTYGEILKDGYRNTHLYINQRGESPPMDIILANTIQGFSDYLQETRTDLIVVHGDRVEAMAGAIVAVMNNITLAHVEGGEVSGTIDESIRHAVTKLAHIHLVANDDARRRIIQLGERPDSIHVIGSPDIDVMLGPGLPSLETVRTHYEIGFDSYAIAAFHPVTTAFTEMPWRAREFVDALLASEENYVVISPNNDKGREFIMLEFERLRDHPRFRVIPSMRFEYYLTLLKNARFVVGNSSAGVREAGAYGVRAVDVGDRQQGRYVPEPGLGHADHDAASILATIGEVLASDRRPDSPFGAGNSTELFLQVLEDPAFWAVSEQKVFHDLPGGR